MRLYELSPRNPIDRELEKTASNVGKNGSLDPEDIEDQEQAGQEPDAMGMDDPMGGPENAPDGAMAGQPALEPAPPAEPVDSALLSRVQAHPYIQRYNHDNPDSETHPLNILNLDMAGLTDLRKRIRVKNDRIGLEDRVGGPSSPESEGGQTMLSFVDTIMAHQKKAAKTERTTSADKPKVREQPKSKTAAGKQFKAKRS